jgi:hypothetical protein
VVGLDDISNFLLKKCVSYMLKTLLELVNITIRGDIFPSTFKKLVIEPSYKKIEEK